MDLNQSLNPIQLYPEFIRHAQVASFQDYAECRRIMQAASKNYSFASKVLPASKLAHVEALYALMRVGDDRVDVSHTGFQTPLEAIDHWEAAYWNAFETGDSSEPVMRAYLDTAIRFQIPADIMGAYFRAMRDDLTITRFPSFADLYRYMEGSAIPVGRAMTRILGILPPYRLEDVLPGADALAVAMQLSNFWRDIGYDWSIGRVYVPLEDMAHFGVSEEDLRRQCLNQRFIDLLEFEMQRTEEYYAAARRSVRMLASGQWAVMGALEIYHAILPGIRHNAFNVFSQRAGASKLDRIRLTIKAFWEIL